MPDMHIFVFSANDGTIRFNDLGNNGGSRMNKSKRLAIMDIGSNSIRLVIYEYNDRSHRVIDESKEAARLSDKIDYEGNLLSEHISDISDILNHFKMLCEAHQVDTIRAVATAAIRNAANSSMIIQQLEQQTNLDIEVLSGEDEARYGFIGTINSIDIHDGFMIDIGGGSTEITLFQQRKIKHSISFPFGAVNMTKQYSDTGVMTNEQISDMQNMIKRAFEQAPWLLKYSGLPLIGLGGTLRSICKMIQKQKKYSLSITHNYQVQSNEVSELLHQLAALPIEKRKKIEGLGKNRLDIIVPGMVLLHTIFNLIQSTSYIISGSGLRDGLLYETLNPEQPLLEQPLEFSVHNLLRLHPYVSVHHVEQVKKLALALHDAIMPNKFEKSKVYLETASLLYRIGISVHLYNYDKHTFYLIAHSRLNGISHRDILICALVASYKSKGKLKPYLNQYQDILYPEDAELIIQVGTLLQLAIALDRSETQPIQSLNAKLHNNVLVLHILSKQRMNIEMREVETLQKDLLKQLGCSVDIQLESIHN
jgi:exopolyphosphatase/guanosine-5'-triphosphate,3'-diphosphate pyrophosphatase